MKTYSTLAVFAVFVMSALVVTSSPVLAQIIECGEFSQETFGTRRVTIQNTEDLSCDGVSAPALTIEGPISVDLNGITISCEPANVGATGIVLIGSGVTLKNGTISDCGRYGIVVAGNGKHQLHRLTVESKDLMEATGGAYDGGVGIAVMSNDNQIIKNEIKDYAGEGIRFTKDGEFSDKSGPFTGSFIKANILIGNNNHAIRVELGDHNWVIHNVAYCNLGEGLRSQGKGNKFIGNYAANNADEGIRLRDESAQHNLVAYNHVVGNGFSVGFTFDNCDPIPDPYVCNPAIDNPGIAITSNSSRNKVIFNIVEDNCIGIGIQEGSSKNTITDNSVEGSNLVDLADQNPNCDENKWRRNEFETSNANCIR